MNAIDSVLCNRLTSLARPVAYIRFGRRSWLSLCLCNLAKFRTADTNEQSLYDRKLFVLPSRMTDGKFIPEFISRPSFFQQKVEIYSAARDSEWYFKRRKKRRAHVNGKVSAVLVITQLTKGAVCFYSRRERYLCACVLLHCGRINTLAGTREFLIYKKAIFQ